MFLAAYTYVAYQPSFALILTGLFFKSETEGSTYISLFYLTIINGTIPKFICDHLCVCIWHKWAQISCAPLCPLLLFPKFQSQIFANLYQGTTTINCTFVFHDPSARVSECTQDIISNLAPPWFSIGCYWTCVPAYLRSCVSDAAPASRLVARSIKIWKVQGLSSHEDSCRCVCVG